MKKISALLLALVAASSFGFNQNAYAKSTKSANSDTIQVAGYTKKDGTVVKPYTRKRSTKSADSSTAVKTTKSVETPAATEKTESTKVEATSTKESTKKGKHSK
jgi:hypothetical protein